MLDAPSLAALPRVRGRAMARLSDGVLRDLHQAGSAKALLPRVHERAPEVVFLNTAGGLTGGDRLDYCLEVPRGAARATTQTAERLYRSTGPMAEVETCLSLGPGARLHWLPQEMILFQGGRLRRRLMVEMAEDAELVMLETLVLGRRAMGERLHDIAVDDRREVRRAGRLALCEAVRLGPEDLGVGFGPAGLDGAVALASLSCLAPDAEDRLERVRAVLREAEQGAAQGGLQGGEGVRAAASAWDGRLTVRFLARDAYLLRKLLARAVVALTGAPVPRVWQI